MSLDKIWYVKCGKSLWRENRNVGSLCGGKTEMCEELRKRRVHVCCMQEVRWKGQGACFVGTSRQRYNLWWSGIDAGFGGVGILVKEEISGNVVEVRQEKQQSNGNCANLRQRNNANNMCVWPTKRKTRHRESSFL